MNEKRQAGLEWLKLLELKLIRANTSSSHKKDYHHLYISEGTLKETKAAWVLVWMILHCFFDIFIHPNFISPLTLYYWSTIINVNHALHSNLEHKYIIFFR